MPINELEQHPCLNYLEQENIAPLSDYQGLIVGNFPSYGCTDSLNENLEITERRLKTPNFRMKFFYSNSPTSYKFWEYMSGAYELPNPVNNIVGNTQEAQKEEAIRNRSRTIVFLQSVKLLITDTIWRMNREEKSKVNKDDKEEKKNKNLLVAPDVQEDYIVRNLSLNNAIVEYLFKHKTINNLYFTSEKNARKGPYELFKNIFNNDIKELKSYIVGNIIWAMEIALNDRYFKVFFLPTTRGVDNSHPMYEKFVRNHPNEETDLAKFRVEAYKQAFIKKNLDYNGSNPI